VRGFFVVAWKVIKGVEVHLGMIYAYLLLVVFGMLVPVITTAEGMPHGLRSIGLVVPVFILAGTAGAVVTHWGMRKFAKDGSRGIALGLWYGLVVGLVVLGAWYDGALYFLVARNDADAYYAYRADLTEVSKYINYYVQEHKEATRPYLVLDKFSVQTVHWLTSVSAHEYTVGDEVHSDEEMHKWELLDPAQSHLTQVGPGEIIIFTQSTLVDADRYKEVHPGARVVDRRYNRFGQEVMRVYGLDESMPAVEGTQDEAEEKGFDLDA
jgi:hypothetical protein